MVGHGVEGRTVLACRGVFISHGKGKWGGWYFNATYSLRSWLQSLAGLSAKRRVDFNNSNGRLKCLVLSCKTLASVIRSDVHAKRFGVIEPMSRYRVRARPSAEMAGATGIEAACDYRRRLSRWQARDSRNMAGRPYVWLAVNRAIRHAPVPGIWKRSRRINRANLLSRGRLQAENWGFCA